MRRSTGGVARALVLCACLTVGAAPASADWLFTPYLGVTFGGDARFGDVGDFEDEFEKKVTYGGALAWMGGGIIGFEIDLGSTPNFFEVTTGAGDFDFGDSNVTTLMGNLVVGAPIGGQRGAGVRPYGSAGIGLLRSNVSLTGLFDDLSTNELGMNVGGGVHVFFTDTIGVRGDVRYFRGLEQRDDDDPAEDDDFFDEDFGFEDFDFWRATIGITFRFGG